MKGSLALLCIFMSMMSALSFSATTDIATVTINGTIKASTCTLDDKAPKITLPDVDVADFKGTKGTVVSSVDVPITFSNCGSDATGMTVKVTCHAAGTDNMACDNMIASGTADRAGGVGMYFYDADGTQFNPDGSTVSEWDLTKGKTITYKAKYVSIGDTTLHAGDVQSVITIGFTYK